MNGRRTPQDTVRTSRPQVESWRDDPLWMDPNLQRFLEITAQAVRRSWVGRGITPGGAE